MTAVATGVAPPLTPTVRQGARRLRFPLLVVVLVLVIAAIPILLSAGAGSAREFAPDGRAPSGAGALTAVLGQQGVQVRSVTSLDDARAGGDATLLVDDQDHLLTDAEWRTLAAAAPALVVVDPGGTALAAVTTGLVDPAGDPIGRTASAGCRLAAARRGGTLALDGSDGGLRSSAGTLCFRDSTGAGQVWRGRVSGVPVTLIASPKPFENGSIGDAGNAAVALGLLGGRSQLVWYVPDPLDLPQQGAPTLQQLTPPWVTPFMALLLTAGLAAALWRGRRLGPLVVERLPVVVRTRETVEGRARLYERGRARLRAADALRMGTIARITPLIGLQRTSTLAEVVAAAAARTGRSPADLQLLLVDAVPGDDAALVRLSDDLAALERAVHPKS